MSQLNVAQIQGLSPTFNVELEKGSSLDIRGEIRIINNSHHPLPVADVKNYFAVNFNPVNLFTGASALGQEPFATSANQATMSADATVTDSPAGGVPLRMVSNGSNDPYTSTYNNSQWNVAEAKSGDVWTFSVYVKSDASRECQLFLFEADASGAYTSHTNQTFTATTSWQRFSVTRTLADSTTTHIQVRVDGADTGNTSGDTWWFDGIQVEKGSTLTTFDASKEPEPLPNDSERGMIRWKPTTGKIEARTQTAWMDSGGTAETYNNTASLSIGTQGNGGGWTVAEGANNTNHLIYTHGGMKQIHRARQYNDGASGDETRGSLANMRNALDYVSSTNSADFAFHTGHGNPGNVAWPQYLAIRVTDYKYGKVLNRIRWFKHANAIGNCNIWGSNQDITRRNYANTSTLWTYLDRLHFGGSGSGSEGGEVSRSFSNTNGYRWYMIEMVDINSSALTYPNVGSQGGWAMYGMTWEKT